MRLPTGTTRAHCPQSTLPPRAHTSGRRKPPGSCPCQLILFVRHALLYVLLAAASNANAQSLPGPEILSDQALNRAPQDFAGLPSVVTDDLYVPPLLWPVDSPL